MVGFLPSATFPLTTLIATGYSSQLARPIRVARASRDSSDV